MGGADGILRDVLVGEYAKKLIAEAVDCARGDAPPPPELSLAWKCKRWGLAPIAGGMMDQDAGLMHRMTTLENVYNVVTTVENMHGDSIHNLTTAQRRLIRWLRDEGLM